VAAQDAPKANAKVHLTLTKYQPIGVLIANTAAFKRPCVAAPTSFID